MSSNRLVALPQNDVHTGGVRKKSWYETCSWFPCVDLDYVDSDMFFRKTLQLCFIFARNDKDLHSASGRLSLRRLSLCQHSAEEVRHILVANISHNTTNHPSQPLTSDTPS